jgi:hypothetical protein
MKSSSAQQRHVVVLGDVTLDLLEEPIRRERREHNFEHFPGFLTSTVWGGAKLVERLIKEAVSARGRAEDFEFSQLDPPTPGTNQSRQYVQSLAVIKSFKSEEPEKKAAKTSADARSKAGPDGKAAPPAAGVLAGAPAVSGGHGNGADPGAPLRVDHFKGFSVTQERPAFAQLKKQRQILKGLVADTARVSALVIDDAANTCRHQKVVIDLLRDLVVKSELIVIKLSRPLAKSDIIDTVRAHGGEARKILVLNAEDLRMEGVDISRRLSWERTSMDLVTACAGTNILSELRSLGDMVVRLGNDGCIVMTSDANYLLFDPTGMEDSFDRNLPGTMPGATSAFVAELTAKMLIADKDDHDALVASVAPALMVSRKLLSTGFVRIDWPDKKTTGRSKDKNGGEADPGSGAGGDPVANPAPALEAPADEAGTGEAGDRSKRLGYPLRVFDNAEERDAKSNDDDKFHPVFSRVKLPPAGANRPDWSILDDRLRKQEKIPRRLARDGEKRLKGVPITVYEKLTVIDRREIEGYRSIENLLHEYIQSVRIGTEKKKPLSIAVFGPPGAGKSFGVIQIANSIKGARILQKTFNLTQLEGPGGLVTAFHIARDAALRGEFPLLIFDEFDSSLGEQPWGWLKYFLAPMQDGEFKDTEIHPLAQAIFVFTGGTAETFAEFEKSKSDDKFKAAKGPDFVSRLKGYVDVQGINPPFEYQRDKEGKVLKDKEGKKLILKDSEGNELRAPVDAISEARRAILLRSLLRGQKERTSNLFQDERLRIDRNVLEALLKTSEYIHGARSLGAILEMSRLTKQDTFSAALLPSDDQLKLHVSKDFIELLQTAP